MSHGFNNYFRLVLSHLGGIRRFYPLDKIFQAPVLRAAGGRAIPFSGTARSLDPKPPDSSAPRAGVHNLSDALPLPGNIPEAQSLRSASYRTRSAFPGFVPRRAQKSPHLRM